MNIPKKTILLLTSAALFTSTSLSAVETDPVGYVSQVYSAGTYVVSTPLLNSTVFQAAAGTVAGSDVVLTGLPSLPTSHFLLVTSGTAAGRFETILSTSGDTATLEKAISGFAEGDSVKVIEHFTLGDLHVASGNSIPDNTTLTIYNSDGTDDAFISGSNTWVNLDGFAVSNHVAVFPGEGVVLSFAAETTLTFTGSVNVDPITVEATQGVVNVLGSLNPTTPDTPGSVGAGLAASLGDNSTITLYSNDGNLTSEGVFILGGGQWVNLDGFAITNINEAAPGGLVLSPSSTGSATIPPAYAP